MTNRSEYWANVELSNSPQYNEEMARWIANNRRAAAIRSQARKVKESNKPRWWEGWFAW